MGDALCGPSNALQNFQKHVSVDRTLQQDRLISRQSPSQGFRSQNPSERILDPEFAAFESNNSVGATLPNIQHGGHFITPAPHMPMSHPADPPNWASDFQNLHISGPSQPISHQPGPSAATMSTVPHQAWHSEFLRQQQQQPQHTPALQQNQPSGQMFQPSLAPAYAMAGLPMGTYGLGPETVQSSGVGALDDSAFEAAFEQAKADMAFQFEESAGETKVTEHNFNHETEEVATQPIAQGTIRIGSDTIPQVDKDDPQAAENEADELARTAGHLLNSVSHETNQKFRDSNFLALMRRIRDREVQLEGDEFRETAQSLHPGGPYYPEGKRQELEKKKSWRPIGQNDYVHITPNDRSKFSGTATPSTLRAEQRHRLRDLTAPQQIDVISERMTSHVTGVAVSNTPTAEPTGSPESNDHDSIYASWNHGDRWA
ncbi:protein pex20 [Aspergillus mulundensis]|uniref:Peroxin 20 n=1 Tax=Aspergillus mulundensis TaxID=1810919 RepID=A0A3D8QBY8_9EURO|nr:Uncharacterized protein DSM5745_11070 [Aspergillus mulundensis]RDW59375.1 Uncharacterized protein DSM5745_11070 [Aspergillus mulundensis]